MGTVAVTFPTQGLVVEYTVPAPFRGDPKTHYQAIAKGLRASRVVPLKESAALVIPQDVGQQHNFGSVSFKLNRSEVVILGHKSERALEDLALSIVRRSSSVSGGTA
jgi:hypothetical protein